MKKISRYYKKIKIAYIKTAVLMGAMAALFLPNIQRFEKTGDNWFSVKLNGIEVGVLGDTEDLKEYIQDARRSIAGQNDELIFIDTNVEIQGKEVLWGKIDSDDEVRANIENVLRDHIIETLQPSYTVKVNEYTVSVSSVDEVKQLLQATLDKYAAEQRFQVDLVLDSTREFNVLTTTIISNEEVKEDRTYDTNRHGMRLGGITATLNSIFEAIEPAKEKDWNDFELGLLSIDFLDEVEVVESYLPASQITPIDVATEEVTKDKEKNTVYEVVSGDTLSGISLATNIPLDKLIELNESLENENSVIRAGEELIITVPEPELSVVREEELYYEEEYEEEIVYVDNNDWYITETKTLQEPSAGFRKIITRVKFRNEAEISREIMKEEVVMEAVPKIVERGTKIPPTFIKPLSGGRLTSNYGRRKSPTKGASSNHKGIDWATPTGTAVFASCSGTVSKAGWGSGYGYVVYINHPDGRQTRYAHLSKVLVSPGQKVSQGHKIALSGNTGISSGPHVHFEMLINGAHVNPLNYLN